MDTCKNTWYRRPSWNVSLVDSTDDDSLGYESTLSSLQILQQAGPTKPEGGCVRWWYYAYLDEDIEQRLTLNTKGCGPSQDCTAACSTVEEAYRDPETLSNCIILPVIESLVDHNLLTPSALANANTMGIRNSSQRTSKEDGSPLIACLSSLGG